MLDEVRHRNLQLYNRLRECTSNASKHFCVFSNEHHRDTYIERQPGESPNDRNDRAIRRAAEWYALHLAPSGAAVVMVTNDQANKCLALATGLPSMSLHQLVQSYTEHPELMDLVARPENELDDDASALPAAGAGRRRAQTDLYPSHLAMSEVMAGIRRGSLRQGVFHANRYNMNEAHVALQAAGAAEAGVGIDSEGTGGLDPLLPLQSNSVLVSGLTAQNRATDGDIVAVEMLPKEQWTAPSDRIVEAGASAVPEDATSEAMCDKRRPCARVVGIIRRLWRPYCGTVDVKNCKKLVDGVSVSLLFVPAEKTIPRIRVKTRQAATLANKRVVVAIDTWDRTSRYPQGHYVRVVGNIGDKAAETEMLLLENEIPTRPFSQKAMIELPAAGSAWRPAPDEIARRVDYREIAPRICSIDPPGCTDIDDALHCRSLSNGNFEVGVHIADVTYFLSSGSTLDSEALERGTTVYLVDRRIEMLPALLTSDLCSLRADVDRLAFSVVWELDGETLDIIGSKFHRSVIKSCKSFTYGEAQLRMDDEHLSDPLTRELRLLNRIAKKLRAERFERGALTLASPEVKFQLDSETQNPNDVAMYELKEANAMVEEFMLLANVSVGEKILQHFPTFALLRRHPAPPAQNFDWLIKSAAAVGVEIDISSSKRLSETLDAARVPGRDYFQTLLRIMATRCMTRALYFCTGYVDHAEYLHYGLAAPVYTHFTSPIRRYADVVVHRLLAASLRYTPVPAALEGKSSVHDICEVINRRNHAAQMASRGSTALHTLLYFKNREVLEEAMVMKVRANGFIALVPRFGVEGIVYVHDTREGQNDDWTLSEDEQTLSGPSGVEIRVFDTVAVKLSAPEHSERVKMELASDLTAESATRPTCDHHSTVDDVPTTVSNGTRPNESAVPDGTRKAGVGTKRLDRDLSPPELLEDSVTVVRGKKKKRQKR